MKFGCSSCKETNNYNEFTKRTKMLESKLKKFFCKRIIENFDSKDMLFFFNNNKIYCVFGGGLSFPSHHIPEKTYPENIVDKKIIDVKILPIVNYNMTCPPFGHILQLKLMSKQVYDGIIVTKQILMDKVPKEIIDQIIEYFIIAEWTNFSYRYAKHYWTLSIYEMIKNCDHNGNIKIIQKIKK